MPSYVVTGAARGLGYEFLRQFSATPDATVFGLVRNASATKQKVEKDNLKNVHIVEADITDRKALAIAAEEVARIVPSVDYLINNAAFMGGENLFVGLSDYKDGGDALEEDLSTTFRTNVIGVVNVINTFLPLVQKSNIKKVVAISSGAADLGWIKHTGVYEMSPYAISKAALNTVMTKYHVRHGKSDGILFLSISPGVVDTGNNALSPEGMEFVAKFGRAFPDFTGPITPELSVTMVREVIEKANAENEFGGAFVSHNGSDKWL